MLGSARAEGRTRNEEAKIMKGYGLFALAVLSLYGVSAWKGWEMGSAKRGLIPASVRSAPGGYRSYGYWRGGK